MKQLNHANTDSWQRAIRLIAVVFLVLIGANALTAQPASALIRTLTKQQLKEMCDKAGGQYQEWPDGSSECADGGYTVECDANGVCTDACYVDFGCTCQDWMEYCIQAKPLPNGTTSLGDLYQEVSGEVNSPPATAPPPGPILPPPPLNTTNGGAEAQEGSPQSTSGVTVNLLGCPSTLDLETATYAQLAAGCQQPLGGVSIGLAHLSGTSGTIETRETSAQPPARAVFTNVAPGAIRLVAAYSGETTGMAAFCGAYSPPDPGPTSFTRFPVSLSAMETNLASGNSLYCDWFVGLKGTIGGASHRGVGTSPSNGAGQSRVQNRSAQTAGTPIAATPAS